MASWDRLLWKNCGPGAAGELPLRGVVSTIYAKRLKRCDSIGIRARTFSFILRRSWEVSAPTEPTPADSSTTMLLWVCTSSRLRASWESRNLYVQAPSVLIQSSHPCHSEKRI